MEIGFVLFLVGLTVVVLASERFAVEVYAILLMVLLVVTGTLTPHQAFAGLASSTVVMLAGVMLLTGAILHNGAAELLARRIRALAGTSERRMSVLLIGATNVLSSVINNVAATAVFIPVAEGMAAWFRTPRARYLMPLAFASMTGGMCTLIGTSTNVAVSGALELRGMAPLGMFELTPVGVIVAVIGTAYLVIVAPRLLGRGASLPPLDDFHVREFLYEVFVREDAPFAQRTLAEADLQKHFGLDVLAVIRGDQRIDAPDAHERILPGDLLLVKGEAGRIAEVRSRRGLEVKSMPVGELEAGRSRLAELTISYNSPFIGKTLQEQHFRKTFGVSVLAIHRREEVIAEKVGKIRLKAGDVLLAYGGEAEFRKLTQEETHLLVEAFSQPEHDPGRALRVVLVLVAAIVGAGSGWLDAPTAFLGGAGLVLALGYLPAKEAGGYLNLRFLVLLAGMAALGTAMDTSGAAAFVADLIVGSVNGNPWLTMAALYVLTVLLTQPLSNAAAALLVLPMALEAAATLGVDPRAYAIVVTVAASCSFITPLEPACLLVYGTGHYRFTDFVKVGSPLTVLAGILTLVIVPLIWPLRP